MKQLIKSPRLQKEFDENGFVRVPFLTEKQADELFQLYKTIEAEHEQIGIPFITTSHSNNHELIRKADALIAGIFKPEMDKFLTDYNLLFGNFLIKQPGPDSATTLHQDTTFVDETKFSSISVWVSLQDTNKQNGCMRFVRGSHKFRFTLRPSHTYPWPYEGVKDKLEKLLVDYPSKKGEAFIFHHGVIHASYANLTETSRVAALMAAYPAETDLLMLFQDVKKPEVIQKYKMSREAFLNFVKGQPPALGELIGEEQTDFKQISPDEFERMLPTPKIPIHRFAERLFSAIHKLK